MSVRPFIDRVPPNLLGPEPAAGEPKIVELLGEKMFAASLDGFDQADEVGRQPRGGSRALRGRR